jgi:hypothetical protein
VPVMVPDRVVVFRRYCRWDLKVVRNGHPQLNFRQSLSAGEAS